MQKQEKSRKPLLIGIIAAVVILAVLLILLLTQCTGGQGGESTSAPTETTSNAVPTYQLYWNADRAEYDGKSEAGMSSRMPEEDGYFHVRFILDGQEVVLKVADRKLINAIDVQDVMGLEFDDDGIVIGVISLDDMPLEKVGWQFFVQSGAKTAIKLNSSQTMNGMEVLLELADPNVVYDMTGMSGPKGCITEALEMDKVMAVANLAGEITHVFIYERPNYMLTHEGHCQHCDKTVTWYEWVKTDAVPVSNGHYQLQNDVQLKGQPNILEDAKLCLDLNGKRIDGATGSRAYAMFNAGITFAIMDTSEEQTGVVAAHGKGDQGMCVWVRYGALYLYSGTLDASDATTTRNGTAVECGAGKYFYMNGGKIIGGTATYTHNEEKNTYGAGLGGALMIGGKFVMNDGIIENGFAESAIIYKNGSPTYQRGMGGNIFFSSSAEFEMNGGIIRYGHAGNCGGNIYADGAATLTINGGSIQGGYTNAKGKNGGSIFLSSKSTTTMNGGSIVGGVCRNEGGNIYLNGTFTMNSGYIGGGALVDFATGKRLENKASYNLFIVNGKFTMWGGTIVGGVQAIDTSATDTKQATVALYGYAKITGAPNGRNLTLSQSGSNVKVIVGNLYDAAKIGVYATTGFFTEPTKQANQDNFYSDIEGAEVLYHSERLALGKLSCICGNSKGTTVSGSHINGCNGEVLVWAPWISTTSIPTATGNYYLLDDVTTTAQTTISAGKDVKLDLNSHNITLKVRPNITDGFRLYRADNGAKLAITDTTTTPGTLQTFVPEPGTEYTGGKLLKEETKDADGNVIKKEYYEEGEEEQNRAEELWANGNFGMLLWARGGEITVHNGIFDGSNLSSNKTGMVINVSNNTVTNTETGEKTTYTGVLNMYGGTVIGGYTRSSGNVTVSAKAVMNLYGGTITGGRAYEGGNISVNGTLNMYGGTVTDGWVDRSKDVTSEGKPVDGGLGGNIQIGAGGTMNMSGGTVSNGNVVGGGAGGGHGGNINVAGTLNATGGVIRDGVTSSQGGNIATIGANSLITLDGVQVLNGQASTGGNVAIAVRTNRGLHILGKTVISGGNAKAGGNISVSLNAKSTTKAQDQIVVIDGATVADGTATVNGGNIYLYNPTVDSFKVDEKTGEEKRSSYKVGVDFTVKNATVTGGIASGTGSAKGGNIFVSSATVTLDNTKVADGQAIGSDNSKTYPYGGNICMENLAEVYLKNGTVVSGGVSDSPAAPWRPAGNFYVNSGLLDITDSTVTGGSASEGNNIYLNYNGTMNLHSGTIENTVAGANSIMMQGGTFTMNGGSVINAEGIRSRNISTNTNAKNKDQKNNPAKWPTFIMNGGTVSGGNYGGNGGNIYATYGSTVQINGGKLVGGHSDDSAGNIYSNENLTVTGGEISGGTATKNPNASNVFMVKGALDITGGVIDGGVNQAYTVKITMSGKPVINNKNNGITIGDNDIHITGTLQAGSSVWVNGSGIISNVTDEANEQYFHASHGAPSEVMYITDKLIADSNEGLTSDAAGKLFIGGYYCICGETSEDASKHLGDCGGKMLLWKPWTSTNSIPNTAGNWYLVNDVTAPEKNTNFDTTITMNLDLNDKTITQNGNAVRMFRVYNSNTGDFTVKIGLTNVDRDNDPTTGKIDANVTNAEDGSIIWLGRGTADTSFSIYGGILDATGVKPKNSKGGTIGSISVGSLNIYGGELIGGTLAEYDINGGSICVNSNGTMNMYGGVLRGGKAPGGATPSSNGAIWGGYGGNVMVRGTLNMYGGVIKDGEAKRGANVCLQIKSDSDEGTLNMYGGVIAGGVDMDNRTGLCQVNLYGTPVIDKDETSDGVTKPALGLNLRNGVVVDATGMTGGEVWVTGTGKFGVTVADAQQAELVRDSFYSEVEGADIVLYNKTDLYFGMTYCLCGYTKYGSTFTGHESWCDQVDLDWVAWDAKSVSASANYYLDSNKTVTGQIGIYNANSDIDVNLDLNGKQLFNDNKDRLLSVRYGAHLSITDTSANRDGVMRGSHTGNATTIHLLDTYKTNFGTRNTVVNLYAGTVSQTPVTDGYAPGSGVVTLGGYSENTHGVFNMYGGTITGAETAKNAGNVDVAGECEFNMYGGTISDGKAAKGGNVYVTGAFNMYDGTISGGVASSHGGNVYVAAGGTFTMKAGEQDTNNTAIRTITGGKAAQGGNVFVYGGTFNMSGANTTVSDGIGTSIGTSGNYGYGGNFYLDGDGSISLTDGAVVSGGYAESTKTTWVPGGSMYLNNGTLNITDATITGGQSAENAPTAGVQGNNLYMNYDAVVNLNSGSIENTANNARENIYMQGGVLNIKGGSIHNVANASSRNIYGNNNASGSNTAPTVNMSGGKIYGGNHTANGGNVGVFAKMTFTMTGGEIYGGTSGDSGGNVNVNGTLNVSGGKIYGGTARAGKAQNVFVVNGTVEVSGGEIGGGMSVINYNNGTSTLTLKNAPVIDKTGTNYAYSLYLGDGATMDVKDLTGGEIYVTATIGSAIAKNAEDGDRDFVLSEVYAEDTLVPITFNTNDSMLYLGSSENTYCVCGGTKNGYTCADYGCNGSRLVWKEWTETTSLPTASGNYRLTGNVTLTAAAVPEAGATIRLDLGGYTVSLENDVDLYTFTNDAGVTLIVTDTSAAGTGKIAITGTSVNQGGIIYLNGGNTFELYRATLDASGLTMTKTNSAAQGGAVMVRGGATMTVHSGTVIGAAESYQGGSVYIFGTLNLEGGEIKNGAGKAGGGNVYAYGASANLNMKGGTVSGGKSEEGGGNIRIGPGASFTMTGGTVKGGTSDGDNSANVFVQGRASGSASLTMSGGEIWGGVYIQNHGGTGSLNLSGSPVIDGRKNDTAIPSVTLRKTANSEVLPLVTITGALSTEDSIGINSTNVLFATAGEFNEASIGAFFADDGQQWISYVPDTCDDTFTSDDIGKLYIGGKIQCACGGKAAGMTGHTCQNRVWTTVTDTLPTASGNYILTQNIDLTKAYQPDHNAVICIDLAGFDITATGKDRVITTLNRQNVALHITDTSADMTGELIAATTSATNQGGVMWLTSAATGTNVAGNNTCYMYAGTMDASNYVALADFTAQKTNGVYSRTGTYGKDGAALNIGGGCNFYMYGGEIIGGNTGKKSADYTNDDGSTVTITAEWSSHGGSVAVGGGMYMYGGKIHSGKSIGDGGNMVVSGTFTMYGGSIENGEVGNLGGNIVVYDKGVVTLAGGSVTNGKSASHGGNIQVRSGGKVVVSGANVTNGQTGYTKNSETYKGGNVYIAKGGAFEMSAGLISGGMTTKTNGGTNLHNRSANVHLLNGSSFTMTGGEIKGRVYLESGVTGNISGNSVINEGNSLSIVKGANVTFGELGDNARIKLFLSYTDFTNANVWNNGANPFAAVTAANDVTGKFTVGTYFGSITDTSITSKTFGVRQSEGNLYFVDTTAANP